MKWIGSPNFTKGREGKSIDRVVLHWIVGKLESADVTFQNTTRNTSAHYGIGDDEVHQYVKEENTAHHAGVWAMNLRSIGIEHEGGPDLPISDLTYATSSQLLADICTRHQIPLDREHIIKHNEVRATQCPGTLDIDRIIRDAKKLLEAPVFTVGVTDQTKLEIDGKTEEWQAIRSELLDKRRALPELQSRADQLLGFISKWVEELKLPAGSNLVEIEADLAQYLPTVDTMQKYRDAIEGVVGPRNGDNALLQALSDLKGDSDKSIKDLTDKITELENKLTNRKVLFALPLWKWLIKIYPGEG